LADTFEALLGAIFLDQGIDKAREFLSAHLYPKVEEIVKNKSYIDYKSLLQEIIQSESRVSPTYRVTNSEGPDHDKTFWVQVSAGSRVLGSGQGKSKQEAESAAAARALEALGKL